MTDEEFQAKLNALGLASKNYSSMDEEQGPASELMATTQIEPNASFQPPEEYPGQTAFTQNFAKPQTETSPRFTPEQLNDPKQLAYLKTFTKQPPSEEEIAAAQPEVSTPSLPPANTSIPEGAPLNKADKSFGERMGTGNQYFPTPNALEGPQTFKEFDARLEQKKPALFQNPYAGLSTEEADRQIIAGEMPIPAPIESQSLPKVTPLPVDEESIGRGITASRDTSLEGSPTTDIAPENVPALTLPPAKDLTVPQSNQPWPTTEQSTESTNPLDNPELGDAALKDAQDRSRNTRLANAFGEGIANFAATASGRPFDRSFFEAQGKRADQSIENIKERRDAMIKKQALAHNLVESQIKKLTLGNAKQASDPNSDVSKTARAIYEMSHPEIKNTEGWKNFTANDLKEFGQHPLEEQAKIEGRKIERDTLAAAKAEAADKKSAEAKTKAGRKQLAEMSKTLSPNRRQVGALGQANANFHAAERLEGLVKRAEISQEPLNFTGPESEEFALGVARLLSTGGAQARSQVEALVPQSAKGKLQDTLSWLLNKPMGREQQEFFKRMYSTNITEKEIARQQVQRAQLSSLVLHENLKNDPEFYDDWVRNVEGAGLSEDIYDEFKEARKEGKDFSIDYNKVKTKLEEGKVLPSSVTQSFPKQVSRIDPTTKKTQYALVKDENELAASSQKGFK